MEEPNILIKTALNDAVQNVNAGLSPTAALKKVANDLDLNPNYIQRTGEALNVALHYKHFKTASDRSTEFEIADIPQAIADVFTVNEKTASEYASETFVSGDSNDTVFNYNRILSNPVYKRAFMEIVNASETHNSYPTTFNTVYEKSANYVQKLSKQAEETQVAKIAAELDMNIQFSSLSDEFSKDAGYRTSFEEFESQVFSKHGEASVPYLDLLYKTAKLDEERGVHDSSYIMFDRCKEASLFDELIKSAEAFIETQKIAEEVAESLVFESSYLKEAHKLMGKQAAAECPKCGCTIGKPKKGCTCSHDCEKKAEEEDKESDNNEEQEPEDPVLAEIKKKVSVKNKEDDKDPVLKEALEKEAFFGMIGHLVGASNMMHGLVNEPAHKSISHGMESLFTTKTHSPGGTKPNMTLDNMERKLLLQELMLTDSILSKVSPAKVARAFEQLLRLSPEISKEKEVVRANLRAMVASQAFGTFEADQLTKLDTNMLKRRVATQQFNQGMTEHFKI
jgi:uncharacterized Zn finger protein (UPF0148 family)